MLRSVWFERAPEFHHEARLPCRAPFRCLWSALRNRFCLKFVVRGLQSAGLSGRGKLRTVFRPQTASACPRSSAEWVNLSGYSHHLCLLALVGHCCVIGVSGFLEEVEMTVAFASQSRCAIGFRPPNTGIWIAQHQTIVARSVGSTELMMWVWVKMKPGDRRV